MYEYHFGLKEMPFSLTPDTQYFLNQQSHRTALNTMLLALRHSEGFIKIVGEVGTGKTLLCRILLSRLGSEFVTAYIPNPWLSPDELKSFVAQEVGAKFSSDMPAHELISALYRKLMQLNRNGKRVLLLVDEAQAMPRETIECLRLLSNLETEKRKLLQIILMGQPELDVALSRSDLRQLKQRIVFSEYLVPLAKSCIGAYVEHRLARAGYSSGKLFSKAALWLLARGSAGVPRLLNILAHKSLISAYGKGHRKISMLHVARAIADTEESNCLGKLCAWHCQLACSIPYWSTGVERKSEFN